MKKIIVILLLFAACKSDSRTYVNHIDGQYFIADDTLILQDTFIINRTGYQKIRNGELPPKRYKIKQWGLHSPDAPALIIRDNQITLGQTVYQRIR